MTRLRLWVTTLVVVLASMTLAGRGQQPAAPRNTPPASLSVPPGQARQYTGAPIDVDFQGTDLRTVLRLLADFGGVNLVIDPSVPAGGTEGRVDLKLTQVPWDQVFDTVVRTSQLSYELEGSVVRVVSTAAKEKESRARSAGLDAEKEEAAKASINRKTFVLNYAKGAELQAFLKASGMMSKYANAQFDARTNTLVVTGLPQDLGDAEDLIKQLDQPQPQVEIEAQIVETDHDSARALGIQWGFNGRATPELGNTTPLAFPNNGTISGRTTGQQGALQQGANDPRATALDRTGTAVNLPAGALGNAATSAVGLTLGAINGALSLDVALSALEHKGKTHLLSSPKVLTQNNQEAEVTTGFQVPFQTVSNNTVTIQFHDAALKLTVKPQITSANTVVMSIVLENGFPDFSHNVNGNPTIVTQRAATNVLVPDTQTVVIGGIKKAKEDLANDQTPGIGNVPLLGWLFRRNENSSSTQELLIFITPRIMRGRP